jgi:hypothetical protein
MERVFTCTIFPRQPGGRLFTYMTLIGRLLLT